MQYIYNPQSSLQKLTLKDELYKYIVKVRRFGLGDKVKFRNLEDDFLYIYEIEEINKKDVILTLKEKILKEVRLEKNLEIFWCVIDPKTIEKALAMLNQIGVKKITFIYCQRSQRNFKLDFKRFQKIVINSNQQCGRVHLMEFELAENLEKVLNQNDDLVVLDFGGESIYHDVKKVLVGCEGGFTDDERELFKDFQKISFQTSQILKSETAVLSISAKLLT